MLNDEQKNIVCKMLEISNVIDYNGSRCFYIDGPADSGKTFVYTTLYNLRQCAFYYPARKYLDSPGGLNSRFFLPNTTLILVRDST